MKLQLIIEAKDQPRCLHECAVTARSLRYNPRPPIRESLGLQFENFVNHF